MNADNICKCTLFAEYNQKKKTLFKEETIVHAWNGNIVYMYDYISEKVTKCILNNNINGFAETIAVGNRIFATGGFNPLRNNV